MKFPSLPPRREWPQMAKAYARESWPGWVVIAIGLPLAYFAWPRHFRYLPTMFIVLELVHLIRFIWVRRGGFAEYERGLAEARARRAANVAAAKKNGSAAEH